MSALSPDLISKKHKRELSQLRRGRGRLFTQIAVVSILALALLMVFLSVRSGNQSDLKLFEQNRLSLTQGKAEWSRQFVANQEEFRYWLERRGIAFEVAAFDGVSHALFRSANSLISARSEPGFFQQILISLHFSCLRVAFIIIACSRLWLAALVLGVLFSYNRFKVHKILDLLGQTGNGRAFYSGIRVGLSDADHLGRPQLQVVGLACPARLTAAEFVKSDFATILDKFGARIATTEHLAAVLLAYPDHPSYVVPRDEEKILANFYGHTSLVKHAALVLNASLELHRRLRNNAGEASIFEFETIYHPTDNPLSAEQYVELLSRQMERVLTAGMKSEIASLPPSAVATFVLALEAGKVMAYAFEAGRWNQCSQFPQLCARAILHSVPAFSTDFSFDQRRDLRQAIIYASRRSAFAAVVFPVDMSAAARAVRQWSELLQAPPHQLAVVSDEVELLSLVHEAHESWVSVLFEAILSSRSEAIEDTFASPFNVLFIPVSNIVSLLRKAIAPQHIRRIEALSAVVHQKQRLDELSRNQDAEGHATQRLSSHQKVFAPLKHDEIKALAELHQVDQETVRDWAALRVVLNSHSWLARRVGDYTVGETSLIFAVLKPHETTADCNEHGLIGRSAMVPLRTTRLAERWGRSLGGKFQQVATATMAENRERFDKLLSGASDQVLDDEILEVSSLG